MKAPSQTAISKNALNLSALFYLVCMTIVLLAADGLANAQTFSDTGFISYLNLAILLTCFAYCIWLGFSMFAGRNTEWFMLAFIFLVYLLREADFHTAFTENSLTSWKTYTHPHIPVGIKLISALVFLSLFMCMSYLLSRYLPNFFRAVKKGRPWAIAATLWIFCLGLSRLAHLYLSRTSKGTWQKHGIEEMLEVSAAVFALLALLQFLNHYRDKYKDYFS